MTWCLASPRAQLSLGEGCHRRGYPGGAGLFALRSFCTGRYQRLLPPVRRVHRVHKSCGPVSRPDVGVFSQVSLGPPGLEPGTYGLKGCMFHALDALPEQIAREDARNALYAQNAQDGVSTKLSTTPFVA